jgi:hypothetical protein
MSLVQQYQVAQSVPFESAGFTSENVRDAIVEAKNTAEGKPRLTLGLSNNGTVGNGAWIGFSELLSSPRILFPIPVTVKEFSWVNANVNLGAFNFEFYKNGQLAGNLIATYTAPAGDRVAGYGFFVFPTALSFAAGESLFVKNVRPSGTALADLALTLYAQSN